MTPESYAMLIEWLANGTDHQKEVAKNRLAMPDAVAFALSKSESRSYPSMMDMAGNLAKAAVDTFSAAMHGNAIMVSREEHDRRLAICYSCLPPEGFWDASQGRCMKCGCYTTFKTWLASESQRCPIGKW